MVADEQQEQLNSLQSRLIFEEDAPDVVKRVDDGDRVVAEGAFETPVRTYDYLIQQVWDGDSNSVTDVQYEPVRGGNVAFDNDAGKNEISVVYARDQSGSWQYLFDLAVPSSLRERLIEAIESDGAERESTAFERSFVPDGIQISWEGTRDDDFPVTITVPYSLYAKRRTEGRNTLFDVLPRRSSNDFNQYVHRALTDALRAELDYIEKHGDREVTRYRTAELIAEFVQSIPHAYDRESKGQWNYVRTPEECFAELTADCKDASLLMYHLLQYFEFDPKFVYFLGNAFTNVEAVSETKQNTRTQDSKEGSKDASTESSKKGSKDASIEASKEGSKDTVSSLDSDDLYTNHLAVVLPKSDLEPLPKDVREDLVPIEFRGTSFLYVESTSVQSPGNVPDTQSDKSIFIY